MEDVKTELSKRYYVAEASVWLLGVTLFAAQYIGLDPDQSLPVVDLILDDPRDYPRAVAALLIAFVVYLILAWKQSSRISRKSYWSQAHAGLTILFAFASLWLSYPLIAANTGFASVSPGWFVGFLTIGFFLGGLFSILIFSSLMIRTSTEAKVLNLPRVPVATRAQYKMWIPVVFLLLVAFYILRHLSPAIIKEFGLELVLVGIPFLFIIGEEFAWLFLSQDENGTRIPLAKKIARFKKAHDSHDYSYKLFDEGIQAVEKVGITKKTSPKAMQKAMQEKFSAKSQAKSFRGKLLEEIQVEPYSKDGNPENKSPENRGVKVRKKKGKKDLLRMLISFDDPETEPQEMEIQVGLFETHVEEYLSKHADEADFDPNKMISNALNKSVIQTWSEATEVPPLHRAVSAGLEEQVEELLKQDINVNEQANAGWTALLMASAQGYPRIIRLLLDAGANPDIGNIHSITPLMYGARYDNMDICRCLLEHGANIDLQDQHGDSALMVATGYGHGDVADELLKAGADITLKNREDKTALDVAHDRKQGKIAKKLRLAAKQES